MALLVWKASGSDRSTRPLEVAHRSTTDIPHNHPSTNRLRTTLQQPTWWCKSVMSRDAPHTSRHQQQTHQEVSDAPSPPFQPSPLPHPLARPLKTSNCIMLALPRLVTQKKRACIACQSARHCDQSILGTQAAPAASLRLARCTHTPRTHTHTCSLQRERPAAQGVGLSSKTRMHSTTQAT